MEDGWIKSLLVPCLFLLLIIGPSALQAAGPKLPRDIELLKDVQVIPPDPSVPEDVRFFSGMWVGYWDGTLSHVLVVEKISLTECQVVYAWGRSQWEAAGALRAPCTIGKGQDRTGRAVPKLIVTLPNSTVDYKAEGEKLDGWFHGKWGDGFGKFEHIK